MAERAAQEFTQGSWSMKRSDPGLLLLSVGLPLLDGGCQPLSHPEVGFYPSMALAGHIEMTEVLQIVLLPSTRTP